MSTNVTIDWVSVDSSNIEKYRYDPDTKVLEVKFTNSLDVYNYDEVDQNVIDEFESSMSKGQYFRNYIKGRYRFFKS